LIKLFKIIVVKFFFFFLNNLPQELRNISEYKTLIEIIL
jgi:hypothetical protein